MSRSVCSAILLSVALLLGATPGRSGSGSDRLVFPVPARWQVQVDTATYGPENLWEYIDGAADLFVSYGFEELQCATYTTPAGAEVRAEAYRHRDAANAYGMYSQERSPENAPVPTGTEGCADAGMMNTVMGRWYVKLSGSPSVTADDLLALTRAVDATLGSPRGLPPEFGLLPADGRLRRSEQYFARDFLGYGFLARVFAARYGEGEGAQIFVMKTASPEAAAQVLSSFLRVAGVKDTPSGAGPVHLTDPHHGDLDLVIRGSAVFGLLGCGKNETLHSILLKKLQ